MLKFCPRCGNLLSIVEGEAGLQFACDTCPYIFNIVRKVSSRIYPRLKVCSSHPSTNKQNKMHFTPTGSGRRIGRKCSMGERRFDRRTLPPVLASPSIFHANSNAVRGWADDYILQVLQSRMFTSVARIGATMYRVNTDPILAVRQAVACLQNGHVIAVPTDTVYGLAASAQDLNAVKLLYEIKAREPEKPVAVCVSRVRHSLFTEQADMFVFQVSDIKNLGETSHLPNRILDALLPGPVTVVLKRSRSLNHFLNPGNPLIGIRVPNDTFVRKVAEQFGQPIALTSANASSEPSTLRVNEFEKLWPMLGAVFDGGNLPGSREASTVVDLSYPNHFRILRDGSALNSTLCVMDTFGLIRR